MGKYSGMDADHDEYVGLHSVRVQKKFAMTHMKEIYGKYIEIEGHQSTKTLSKEDK
jgi:hypothetical protein